MTVKMFEKSCEQCGRTWSTRKPGSRTCSPSCRAQLRETEKPSRGRAPREYPAEVIQKVQDLYASGHTIAEIAVEIGTGYKADLLVRRFVEHRRPAVARNPLRGDQHQSWRGSNANYQALHLRVEAARGKPTRCACCDTTDPTIRYEWANLSGRYDDITDYARLCVSCHRRLDAARRAATGKRTSIPKKGGGGDA